ncbi:uncharacterized protein LOC143578413 [Bidens hawaiensis]|uniref:uncharacterized protein LOC143578413 n=1 Tax=Bidens hawaiensis TaxID=980011 RepID=UPI00404AD770
MCNSILLTWILNSVSEELYLGQVYSKFASKVWKQLKEAYDKVDRSFVFTIYQKINMVSQNYMHVFEYYHKLNTMWKQLDQILQLPACTCNASKKFNDFNLMIKLMQFLMGLDSSYQSVRTNLLTREELPTVKEAFSIISREESHRQFSNSNNNNNQKRQSQNVGFVSKSNYNFDNKKGTTRTQNQNVKCSYCNKIGHNIDKCFKIVGYNSWMKPRNEQGKRVSGNNNNSMSDNVASASNPSISGLSSKQILRLLSLLYEKAGENHQSCNVSGNVSPWFGSISFSKPQFCFASSSDINNMTGWVVYSGQTNIWLCPKKLNKSSGRQ